MALGRDTSGLKHGKGRNKDIVLVPQPSESPRDPLNWPLWKKDLLLVIISLDTAVVGAWFVTLASKLQEKSANPKQGANDLTRIR